MKALSMVTAERRWRGMAFMCSNRSPMCQKRLIRSAIKMEILAIVKGRKRVDPKHANMRSSIGGKEENDRVAGKVLEKEKNLFSCLSRGKGRRVAIKHGSVNRPVGEKGMSRGGLE